MLSKFVLYLTERMEFHVGLNTALILFLLLESDSSASRAIKNTIAICCAAVLVVFELGFPLVTVADQTPSGGLLDALTITAQSLLYREFILAPLLIATAYFYFSHTVEFGVFSALALVCVGLLQSGLIQRALVPQHDSKALEKAVAEVASGPMSNSELSALLSRFFKDESERRVPLVENSANFDIVILSVCSLAWDDLTLTGLHSHRLFDKFDLVFDNYNSATSYSGPALIRLLRANCGQPEHQSLFSPPRSPQCLLFPSLTELGYRPQLAMNHDGVFDNFLGQLQDHGGIQAPLAGHGGLSAAQKSFDGTPIYRDSAVLNRWLQQRQASAKDVLLYNTVSLHDGNRLIGRKVGAGLESYRVRAELMLDDLAGFIDSLQQSARPTLVLFVPEHGAGLRGDKLQLTGMREIPSPSITHVPVGAVLVGATREGPPYHVEQDTSHMAIAALIQRVIDSQPFGQDTFHARALADALPSTTAVSQNEGSTVMETDDGTFLTLDQRQWQRYPD